MSISTREYSTRLWPLGVSATAPRKPISEPIVCGLVRLVDFTVVFGISVAAYSVWLASDPSVDTAKYGVVSLFGTLVALNLMQWMGAYKFETLRRLSASLKLVLWACLGTAGILLAISFVTKTTDDFSRVWSLLWFSIAVLLLGTVRIAVERSIRDWAMQGRLYRNVVIVGTGAVLQRLLDHVAGDAAAGMRVLGVFDDEPNRAPLDVRGYPIRGGIDSLIDYVRRHPVDTVIVALPWSAEQRIAAVIDRLSVLPVDVRLAPDMIGFRLKRCDVSHFGDITTLTVRNRPLTGWRLVAKDVEDKVLAAAILAVITVPMLVIAALIKFDSPGPVFFRQKRHGFNNQLIEVLKFRTMHHAARDENAERLTSRNDPRVTRIGALLRRTSLDELPQFINVLRGDMSIVGPRPHALAAKAGGLLYPDAVREYAARHRVKPGITGLAQVNGWRGETETVEQIQKRVEHDLRYIENWSLWLDLKIILRTGLAGFTGRRAY